MILMDIIWNILMGYILKKIFYLNLNFDNFLEYKFLI